MRRLIVNADDFGLTRGINRAVLDLHRLGALHSTTLMASAPRFAEAAEISRQQTSLGVGCHIVLVDGTPVANPTAIPSLLGSKKRLDGARQFRPTLGQFVRDLYLGRIDRAQIEQEAIAQIRQLRQAGVAVTHIDTHKHTHMFPVVLDGVMRAATACDVPAIRNPFEPLWSIRAAPRAGLVRKRQVRLLGKLHGNFVKLATERGFATTDGCVGIAATGTLDESSLHRLLNHLPEGTWELVCHPAYMDAELAATATRLQHSRQLEASALQTLPAILSAIVAPVELIHFGQLATDPAHL
ncbi:MAG: ChbG/HpnK family deacetylase [Acidobacteriaceae bacterium]